MHTIKDAKTHQPPHSHKIQIIKHLFVLMMRFSIAHLHQRIRRSTNKQRVLSFFPRENQTSNAPPHENNRTVTHEPSVSEENISKDIEASIEEFAIGNNMIEKIHPSQQFPLSHHSVLMSTKQAKADDTVMVAWSFDCQEQFNVSKGTVKNVRGRAGKGKISLEYFGIHGHKQGKSFIGFLPPQSNVRVYHLVWKNGEGNYDISQAASDPALNDPSMAYNNTTADMDFEPIPTQRNISPEYASCVSPYFEE